MINLALDNHNFSSICALPSANYFFFGLIISFSIILFIRFYRKSEKPKAISQSIITVIASLLLSLVISSIFYVSIIFLHPCSDSPTLINERLDQSCATDQDCRLYLSHNSCQTHCANHNLQNQSILENQAVTCDPTLWDPDITNCLCINTLCQPED